MWRLHSKMSKNGQIKDFTTQPDVLNPDSVLRNMAEFPETGDKVSNQVPV